MVRGVRQNRFIALWLLIGFVLCGTVSALVCDGHADACDPADATCACDCITCGSGLALSVGDAGSAHIMPPPRVHFVDRQDDRDSGRLLESFIFTPPRA